MTGHLPVPKRLLWVCRKDSLQVFEVQFVYFYKWKSCLAVYLNIIFFSADTVTLRAESGTFGAETERMTNSRKKKPKWVHTIKFNGAVTRRVIWALDDVRITCHNAHLLMLLCLILAQTVSSSLSLDTLVAGSRSGQIVSIVFGFCVLFRRKYTADLPPACYRAYLLWIWFCKKKYEKSSFIQF